MSKANFEDRLETAQGCKYSFVGTCYKFERSLKIGITT
jgi:hypothetical protein